MDADRDMVARVDYSLGRCQVEEPLRVGRANSRIHSGQQMPSVP